MRAQLLIAVLLLAPGPLGAVEPAAPGFDPQPFLRLEPSGPTAQVTGLAFSPDGNTLYVAGFDKVVRVWRRNPGTGRYELTPTAYRIPIGPGYDGAINAMALAPDGKHLAVGGLGVVRGGSGFRDLGLILPAAGGLTEGMREDQGMIWVFDTSSRNGRPLRGHRGPVIALTFIPGSPGRLVSAARVWDATASKFVGEVRLWDAETGKTLAVQRLPNPTIRPSLAARRVEGPQPRLECVIAWGDGVLRRWLIDAAGTGQLQETRIIWPEPLFLASADFMPGSNRLLLVGLSARPLLCVRDATGAELRPEPAQLVEGLGSQAPRTSCFVSAKGDGGSEIAAVAVRTATEYRLRLLDVATRRLTADIPLWSGVAQAPVLASTTKGDYLAVAGAPDNGVRLFKLPLKDAAEPSQILRSSGSRFTQVRFATNQRNELGLLLCDPKEQIVFDLQQQELLPARGWNPTPSPETKPPTRQPTKMTDRVQLVFRQGEQTVTIETKASQRVDGHVFVQTPGITSPLLAVALWDFEAGPFLNIYNAKTGEQVRQYTGHAGPIRSLAASPDGRLLVTAADDETVAIWSLTDLGMVLGRRGQVPGLAVQDKQDKVVVAQLRPGTAAAEQLQLEQVITGLLDESGGVRDLKTARAFYDVVSLIAPGKPVRLKIEGRPEPVRLIVGQGVDERKPLLSLFLTSGSGIERDWIAWSPTGPFERSNLKVERQLGWHFNTGKVDQPASFALAGEYRARYLKPGIVKHLIAQGDAGKALEAWKKGQPPAPRPNLTLLVHEADTEPPAATQGDGPVQVTLRKPKALLRLAIEGLALPDDIDRAAWQLDDAPPKLFDLTTASGQELKTDVMLPERAGSHRLLVTLKTREAEPRTFTREAVLQLAPATTATTLPPLPRVVLRSPTPDFTVTGLKAEAEVTLEARLLPSPQEAARQWLGITTGAILPLGLQPQRAWSPVSFHLSVDGAPAKGPINVDGGLLTTRLALPRGSRRIELETADVWGQRAVTSTQVRYQQPPQIVSLDALPPAEGTTLTLKATARTPVGLPITLVQLNGREVVKEGYHQRVQSEADGDGVDTWELRLTALRLEPGQNRFELVVGNVDGRCVASKSVTVNWQPPAQTPLPPRPLIELLSPAPGSVVSTPAIQVRCRVESVKLDKPVELRVGRQIMKLAPGDRASDGTFESEPLVLEPGPNVIEIRAENAAGERTSTSIVSYSPPPVRIVLEEPAAGWIDGRQSLRGTSGLRLVVDEASGRLALRGHVTWPAGRVVKPGENLLRVHVNGFQQRPAVLGEPRAGKRLFMADVVLAREADNVIELELPGLAAEQGEPSRWLVDCRTPQRPRTLHLLIVGVGHGDAALLKKRALNALEATTPPGPPLVGGGVGSGGAFEQIESQILAGDDITPGQVLYQLHRLRAILERRPPGTAAVMVYFAGPEMMGPTGPTLSTSSEIQAPSGRSLLLQRDRLTDVLHDMQGAKVLLFDTVRPTSPSPSRAWDWPEDARFALLGYAWPQPPTGPTAAPLLLALEESRAERGQQIRLSDVASSAERLRGAWAKSVSDPAGLQYHQHLPEELKPLVVRVRP